MPSLEYMHVSPKFPRVTYEWHEEYCTYGVHDLTAPSPLRAMSREGPEQRSQDSGHRTLSQTPARRVPSADARRRPAASGRPGFSFSS